MNRNSPKHWYFRGVQMYGGKSKIAGSNLDNLDDYYCYLQWVLYGDRPALWTVEGLIRQLGAIT